MTQQFLILGYFGAGNLGDDLMLRGLCGLLAELSPGSTINVVSYYDRELPVKESARLRIVRARTTIEKLRKLAPLMARRPIVFFGGGTPFTDSEGDGSYKFFRLAHLFGCRFGYLSVGLGRLTLPVRRQRAQWLLQHCSSAVFRDRESMRRAIEIAGEECSRKFVLGEDLAYLDMRNWPRTSVRDQANSGDIVLCWRELDGEEGVHGHESLRTSLKEALKSFRQSTRFERLVLLPLDPGVDLAVHRALEQEMRAELPEVEITLMEMPGITETLQAIAGAGLLLSVRLHGAFVGKTLGVPTIGFEYSPKLRYYFESIGSRSLLGWNELSEDPHCLERAANVALAESATQADASKGVHAARQGVVNFLRAFE